MARFAFRGKDEMVFVALVAGSEKTLGCEALSPRRAEIGITISAGDTASLAVKNVAVKAVLYTPVNYIN